MEKHSTLISTNHFSSSFVEGNLNSQQTNSSENDSPGMVAIANILAFSKSIQIKKTHTLGMMEITLN